MQSNKFETEVNLIKSVLEPEEILEISLASEEENSLEISLVLTPDEYIQAYVRPLSKIGYKLYPEDSNFIKLFFQKGDTFKYNLHLTQAN